MNKLIIFDCDGVLVDSKILAHQGDVQELESSGRLTVRLLLSLCIRYKIKKMHRVVRILLHQPHDYCSMNLQKLTSVFNYKK